MRQTRYHVRMSKKIRVSFHIAALGLIALAFFARVYRLADKNIWWDEGWTVWMGQHDWAWIALRTASDEHPPLHYWLMNLWQGVFGPDVVTGRFFSLAFGVLGVALLFLALARFNIWWSQDIKNYTLSAFFAWASVYFVWQWTLTERRAANQSRWKLFWLGYVGAAFLALFSHYLAALIILANNIFVGLALLAQWRAGKNPLPLLWRWSAAQIAVVILLAPWLYLYLQKGATWTAAPTFDFTLFLRLAATVLTLGVTTYIENYTWLVIALLAIAALSAGWILIRQTPNAVFAKKRWSVGYALLIALIPPALIYLLALTPAAIFAPKIHAPKIQARYLMMLTPALALLLAFGVLFAARYSKFVALAL
ncbi:MAG: hypothetical protein DCC52_17780, partial [Chloroflexi bacterium]